MTREQQAISANFDLLLKGLGAIDANSNHQARANGGHNPAVALNPFSQHEQAHEAYLQTISGCDD